MANRTIVASAPHVHGPLSTTRLMSDVIVALMPALAVSVYVYGWGVLAITAVSIGCCVLFEALIQKFLVRGKQTVTNLSAVVTGLLLAMNMPANIPLWIVAVGALVAIGVAKMPFGGLGKNPFNPAIVARVFLLIAYPVQMTSFAMPSTEGFVDAYSGATPLAAAKAGLLNFAEYDALGMFAGNMAGSFGEVATLALLLGFAYLLVRRVITWHIPVAVLGTMAVFAAIYGAVSFDTPHLVSNFTLFHLIAGGAVLGAVFMATDYVTSPMTPWGMVIYGIGIGALTMTIRLWGAYPEGMSFAILIMNSVVPLINKYVKPRRFGSKK
ncbi:MAG: RnfABCDGE type electron transport complex subunit D [Rikenellaceae bacterium]|nr:RnfABCDGE type electron transport complex subunit D [Rikenellaceae bacterium]